MSRQPIVKRQRRLFADRTLDFTKAAGLECIGLAPCQQFVQQHTQYIDVAGSRGRVATHLFGARMIRRHQADVGMSDCHRVHHLPGVQHFGDSEIEQLGNPLGSHQDVRWLEVPMHDEILMRIVNSRTDSSKQHQTLFQCEFVDIAIDIDRQTVDVLHDDIGSAIRRCSAIEQLCDIRMIQRREDLSLDLETTLHLLGDQAGLHEFEGNALTESLVRAFGENDFSHASGAEGTQDPILTNDGSGSDPDVVVESSIRRVDAVVPPVLAAGLRRQSCYWLHNRNAIVCRDFTYGHQSTPSTRGLYPMTSIVCSPR